MLNSFFHLHTSVVLLVTIFVFQAAFSIERVSPKIYNSVLASDELTQASERLRQLSLKKNRQWNKLLHIERNAIGLKVTQVTDPNYFLSNEDRFQDFDEAEATLRAFFEDPSSFARTIPAPTEKLKKISPEVLDHSQHAICRFPARLKFFRSIWTRADLAGESAKQADIWSKLPNVNCTYLSIYTEALQAKSVSFVFSSYYSDSPGSAFGHTFFKINRGQTTMTGAHQELLDYGVGYAANAQNSNPLTYALFGLMGGFTGSWTNVPYYYKVREYTDFESRDLWTYDLNLTSDEVEYLVLHLWEVGAHYYTYYFFTQNCAYHMLTVLEAAAPRLRLSEHVPFYYVIPADSMKALFYNPGLVEKISFRPSIRSTFLSRTNRLDSDHQKKFNAFAKSLSLKDLDTEKVDQRAYLLDAANDLIDLRAPNPSAKKFAPLQKVKTQILNERAKLDFVTPDLVFRDSDFQDPSRSHGSSRVSLYYFEKSDLRSGIFEYRFALHDLLDPTYGLPQNSQLEFFNLSFDILPNELKLRDGALFRVLNLNPINFFETKPSWGVEVGVQNRPQHCAASEYACYLTGMQFKAGYALSPDDPAVLQKGFRSMFWLMGSGNLRLASNLSAPGDLYAAPGFNAGALLRFSDAIAAKAEYTREFPNKLSVFESYDLMMRWSVSQSLGVNLSFVNDAYGAGFNYYY